MLGSKLQNILANVFGLRADQIGPGLTKDDVGNWDSLKQMDLVVSLERGFGVSFEIKDIMMMDSVGSIVSVLESKGVDLGA